MLLGRRDECARLDSLLDQARRGRSGVLALRGEAGVGKSSLLRYAAANATGMHVLEARGVEFESQLVFAGLSDLLRPVLDRLDALPEPQAAALRGALALDAPAAADRFAVYAATLTLLAAVAAERPLAVLVDDAHWLDRASAEALLFTARRLDADPIAIVLAARDGDPPFETPGIPDVRLEGLDAADAAALVRTTASRSPAGEVVERLVHETRGNPLALIEIVGLLSDDQLAGKEQLGEPLAPTSAAEAAFRARLGQLADAQRLALLVAAAAPGDPGAVLAALHALAAPPEALEEAESSGLIAVGPDAIAFEHPLARSAVFSGASAADRRAVHRALAAALTDPRAAFRRAWHLAAAAIGPDEAVARELEEAAGDASSRSGYAAAAAALERAAALTPDGERRAQRLVAAADAARLAGRGRHAVSLLADALAQTTDAAVRARVQHARGRIELFEGRAETATELLVDEAARIEPHDRDRAAVMLAEAAVAAFLAGHTERALTTAVRAREAMVTTGGLAELIATLILGTALCRAGETADGVAMWMRAADIAEGAGEDRPDVEYVLFAALVLVWAGEHARARRLLHRVIDDARTASALGVLSFALYVSSTLDLRAGRWPAAYASASEAVRTAEDTGSDLWRCFALGAAALVEAARGRADDCRAHAAEARRLAQSLELDDARDAVEALGLLELGLGRLDEAIALLEPMSRVPHAGDDAPLLVLRPSTADLLEAYVRSGRAAPPAVSASLAAAEAIEVPSLRATVMHCRAVVAPADEFDAWFADALDAHEAARTPFLRARTELAYGERLRRAGRRVDARTQLRKALETFEHLGARPWAERAANELAATGETLRRNDPVAVDELTPQELQIALVVAGGATNREAGAALFLSPKTIEVHLSRIYRKLGIRSRTELARLAASDALEVAATTV
jgi:DNA-binding CsgD family transcriptional regulator